MNNKDSKIYTKKIDKLKTKVQDTFYYHENHHEIKNTDIKTNTDTVDKEKLISKINALFKRPDYIYQVDTNIMYKNGENKSKKIIGFKDNNILTLDGEKIKIDDIYDVK